jgi:hypothetical protein
VIPSRTVLLLIQSKIHVLSGHVASEGLSDSIKNDLALGCLRRVVKFVIAAQCGDQQVYPPQMENFDATV